MVYPGHRSLGCAPCRASKVKCDQQRPACGRCVRNARICSGYHREASTVRHLAGGAQLLSERIETWQPRASRAVSAGPVLSRRRATPPSPMLDLQMSTDWTECSVSLFWAEYVEGSDDLHTAWGHYEYLPAMYDAGRTTCLTHAVQAAALANAANTSTVAELETLARRAYGKALKGLAEAMSDPELLVMDETLAAMSVLGTYEIIAGQQPLEEVWHAHFFGQSTFLHLRQHDTSATCTSLFGLTNRLLMCRDLVSCSGIQLCVQNWPEGTYRSSLGEKSARLTLRIIDICGRVRKIVSASTTGCSLSENRPNRDAFSILVKDAIDIDRELNEYFNSQSDSLGPWTLFQRSRGHALDPGASIQSLSNRVSAIPGRGISGGLHLRSNIAKSSHIPFHPIRIDIYPTKSVAFIWTTLRAAWLHLSRSIIDLRLFSEDNGYIDANLPPFEDTYIAISEHIETICASVPYSLGDIDQNGKLDIANCTRSSCFHIIWVLHRVCDVPSIDPDLRAWIVSVFERIGRRGVKRGYFLAKLHGG